MKICEKHHLNELNKCLFSLLTAYCTQYIKLRHSKVNLIEMQCCSHFHTHSHTKYVTILEVL